MKKNLAIFTIIILMAAFVSKNVHSVVFNKRIFDSEFITVQLRLVDILPWFIGSTLFYGFFGTLISYLF